MAAMGTALACTTIIYVYPLYATYKVLTAASRAGSTPSHFRWYASPRSSAHRRADNQEDARVPRTELAELEYWCMYWSIIAVMRLLEAWLEWAWNWVPMYAQLKLAFVLWLLLPQTKAGGAVFLYSTYLAPFLDEHESDIDVFFARTRERLWALLSQALQTLVSILGDYAGLGPDATVGGDVPCR
ncbi:hypothetical protein MSPP1_000884 [Malassezia sp. CBS 17886]|nr:hypothetical protein MSPP1_000884 [Malassezia sp. CBS 17886]